MVRARERAGGVRPSVRSCADHVGCEAGEVGTPRMRGLAEADEEGCRTSRAGTSSDEKGLSSGEGGVGEGGEKKLVLGWGRVLGWRAGDDGRGGEEGDRSRLDSGSHDGRASGIARTPHPNHDADGLVRRGQVHRLAPLGRLALALPFHAISAQKRC